MLTDLPWIPIEDDGFIGLIGPVLYKPFVDGVGRFRFTAEEKHRNRAGFVQGGMLMSFADRALGNTARERHPERAQTTVQFDIHFIRAARLGEVVEMECHILKETRSLVFMEGRITTEDELVATVKGIWKIIERRDPPGN
ncbi:PaaI family thioesterase [Rhizobium lusitanum]|uniref:PaaI family thioesterase n=1 Tax=Rhizobium lusitanum TaxID=293958 RepID=A0A6L9UE89_9HYPH|nr:PaaI family thioesterase [Rhizobium lusitanum]NEI72562.1 PaaI family thioesterase [Rhizobium lusitanum]